MSLSRVFVAMLAIAAFGGCASPPPEAPVPEAPAPQATLNAPYRLASGDRLRVIVFGQDDLSNSYSVESAGVISMPLIGRVRAQGLTTAELEREIEARLRQGYLREPSVSAEVEAFRPFFILGEVNAGGQYPFINGMTVQEAVAVAGGFAPRAVESGVDVTRVVDDRPVTFWAPLSYPIRPGDTINVEERFF
jgi:polysaccharide biosynthesis/export protein